MFGHRTPLQLTDPRSRSLLVLAVASVGVYGIVLAGWSSGSTYPLLGGLRSSAQIISYEIAMGLSLVAVFLYAGRCRPPDRLRAAQHLWFILPAIPSFVVYVVTMVGETNRSALRPRRGRGRDRRWLPHRILGSMRFAMFFLGEYINMFTVAALATTLFLGGPAAPPGIAAIGDGMLNQGWWGVLWFTDQDVGVHVLLRLAARLPAPVRYDQFMRFGWKFLIPVAIVWVVARRLHARRQPRGRLLR
jgi:NADH-quinone oxidoreductase subunit H